MFFVFKYRSDKPIWEENKVFPLCHQEALMKSTEGEPEDVWYKDETNEFQEQLKAYEHIVRTSQP